MRNMRAQLVTGRVMRALLLLVVACDAGVPAKPTPNLEPKPPVEKTWPTEYATCDDVELVTPNDGEVLATLHRDACYGPCPVYQVIVYRDGRVEYTGTRYVAACRGSDRLQPMRLGLLRGMFDGAGLTSLSDKYIDMDWTDASTVTTSYRPATGPRKLVEHYHGDEEAPRALTVVEDAFDIIVGTDRWVRVEPPE